MKKKTCIHFTPTELITPTNPLTVNLIGAGGTGSAMLTVLARLNQTLHFLNHPGLHLRLWDDDVVQKPNLGRQLFAESELGLHKSVALINRVNRFFGTDWKAITQPYNLHTAVNMPRQSIANMTVSCVDTVPARFEIADILKQQVANKHLRTTRLRPLYWLDCGNDRYSGQVVLATLNHIKQPPSRKYKTVASLPMVTDEFKTLLLAQKENNTPSCSMAEALHRQSLFINSSLAQLAGSLLEQLFRDKYLIYRGFFTNLKNFRTMPLKVQAPDTIREIITTPGKNAA
ncbi:PRTRC system ThiF family protein [Olivibacter jilunii]|uniref:PRTRC system ThiF family protein n=1 Tax=Olivibacter jilunii TaxID=985016 RepID=UPI00103197DC|nr:PRTRC system ThiF family protein [Olivibacter jilunii]